MLVVKSIRIGTGAGYAGDRIEPAVEWYKKVILIILYLNV